MKANEIQISDWLYSIIDRFDHTEKKLCKVTGIRTDSDVPIIQCDDTDDQAERDLELSWEGIEKITDIWDDLHEDETVYSKTGCDTPEFYKEVLKRFKERKENNYGTRR